MLRHICTFHSSRRSTKLNSGVEMSQIRRRVEKPLPSRRAESGEGRDGAHRLERDSGEEGRSIGRCCSGAENCSQRRGQTQFSSLFGSPSPRAGDRSPTPASKTQGAAAAVRQPSQDAL